jgi:Mycothiol maleylpyruvate isomerase N-terminal domain
MISATFLDAAAAIAPLFREPALSRQWDQPSALAEFRISGLAGHTARAVFNVERYLADPPPPGVAPIDAVTYFGRAASDPDLASPNNRRIRERGAEDAGTGPQDLSQRYDAARERLSQRLRDEPEDRLVLMFGHSVLTLTESLKTRIVELVVHADDLSTSIGVPMPDVGAEAYELAVGTLVQIAARRHGSLALVRALSRRERAPGVISAF